MEPNKFKKYFEVIKDHNPKVKRRNIALRDYGWDYMVFIVNNKTVFRFPRNTRGVESLDRQIKFAKKFQRHTVLSIPQPKLEIKNSVIYATYPLVKGEPLKPVLLKRCTIGNQQKIAKQLGVFLAELHNFPVLSAQRIGVQHRQAGLASYDSTIHFEKYLKRYVRNNEWKWAVNRLKEIRTVIRKSQFQLVVAHNDIAPQHILFDQKRQKLTGIIDFGDLAIGDPAVDFFRLNVYSKSFVEQVFKAYGGRLDKLFFDREKAYQDLTLLHRLAHYIKKGDKVLIKIIRNELRQRIRRGTVS
ncbi:MAG: aminoglycoside phosphotransferase family protein [Patescibacteria group bacterium]|jgi:aminoglycoside 2''-phosphotransferase